MTKESDQHQYLDSMGSDEFGVSECASAKLAEPGRWSAYHLTLLLTVDEVIVVLHRHKLVPPVLFRNVLQCLKLPCRHGASPNIPHPAFLHYIVQSLHDLLSRCAPIQTVDLKHVYVCPQSLNALLYCIQDVLSAQSDLIDHIIVVGGDGGNALAGIRLVNTEVAFRENDDLVPWDIVLLEGFGDDLLRMAV